MWWWWRRRRKRRRRRRGVQGLGFRDGVTSTLFNTSSWLSRFLIFMRRQEAGGGGGEVEREDEEEEAGSRRRMTSIFAVTNSSDYRANVCPAEKEK